MSNNEKIEIRNEANLSRILPKEIRREYSIGIHGFKSTTEYWDRDENGNYTLNETRIQDTKDAILKQGLKIQNGRSLLSTSRFKGLEEYISTRGSWEAGGIIIALPKVLRSEDGEELFLGEPNEENISEEQQWDRNHQITSLGEAILPEDGVLESMFIIGTYSKKDNSIEVSINPDHIAFNNGTVSREYFEQKNTKLSNMIQEGTIDGSLVEDAKREKQNKMISLTELGKKSYEHFGKSIAEKIKEAIGIIKSKFLSKDLEKNDDFKER